MESLVLLEVFDSERGGEFRLMRIFWKASTHRLDPMQSFASSLQTLPTPLSAVAGPGLLVIEREIYPWSRRLVLEILW